MYVVVLGTLPEYQCTRLLFITFFLMSFLIVVRPGCGQNRQIDTVFSSYMDIVSP